ncbi:MAG: histidinol-phosphatase HisJ family protein, partial [Oscillospiraceae bacterium]|nr:histidinol-phosphatase HisJ family protein [Oscillospiraceae bacterium]
LESGLHALTFTDHADVDDYYNPRYKHNLLMSEGAKVIPRLKEEYRGRINVGFGVEIGQYVHNPALAERLISEYNYDFVIGSVHTVRGYEDFYYMDFHKNDPYELLKLYFDELLETVRTADIDVIGHLTYPLRYISGRDKIAVDMNEYADIIREICSEAVKRGKGLEINTGGLRKPEYGKTDPGLEYVRLFRELGGEILTIGSDAHRIADLAANFTGGSEIAKAAGFGKVAYFDKRKPVFVNI